MIRCNQNNVIFFQNTAANQNLNNLILFSVHTGVQIRVIIDFNLPILQIILTLDFTNPRG